MLKKIGDNLILDVKDIIYFKLTKELDQGFAYFENNEKHPFNFSNLNDVNILKNDLKNDFIEIGLYVININYVSKIEKDDEILEQLNIFIHFKNRVIIYNNYSTIKEINDEFNAILDRI